MPYKTDSDVLDEILLLDTISIVTTPSSITSITSNTIASPPSYTATRNKNNKKKKYRQALVVALGVFAALCFIGLGSLVFAGHMDVQRQLRTFKNEYMECDCCVNESRTAWITIPRPPTLTLDNTVVTVTCSSTDTERHRFTTGIQSTDADEHQRQLFGTNQTCYAFRMARTTTDRRIVVFTPPNTPFGKGYPAERKTLPKNQWWYTFGLWILGTFGIMSTLGTISAVNYT